MKSIQSKFLGLILLGSLAIPAAHAQHGSVNGPVTTGPLNPATGATTVLRDKLLNADVVCKTQMIYDMLSPFTGGSLNEFIGSQGPNEYNNLNAKVSIDLQNSLVNGPFSDSLRSRGFKQISVVLDTTAVNLNTQNCCEFKMELIPVLEPNLTTIINFTTDGLPVIAFTEEVKVEYDPITHIPWGYINVVNNLEKGISGTTLPSDLSQISVFNRDGTLSNFKINAQKYFLCIESEL